MIKFLKRFSIFTIFVSLLISPLCFIAIGGNKLNYIDNPVAALIDKQDRLINLKGKRIVIVGGSNAFYGMDSKILSEQLNIEVVNMGLFAGFGLDFMLQQLKGNLRKDDIILFSIEYLLMDSINPKAKESILKYFPLGYALLKEKKTIDKILLNNIKLNVESIQNILLTPLKKRSPTYIQTREMNIYGDAIGYLKYPNPPHTDFNEKIVYKKWNGIKQLNAFVLNSGINSNNFLFVYPPIPHSYYKQNMNEIEKINDDIHNELKFRIICNPSDMVYPDSLFFDTNYHLHNVGRTLRSNKLIAFIKNIISN